MKPLLKFILVGIFLPFVLSSQTELNFDNNLTGIYSQSSSQNLGLNFTGANGFYKNHFSFDLNTNYLLKFNNQVQENELLHRTTLDYDKGNWDAFITHQYNYSLIRKIEADNQIGIGTGLKKKFEKSKVSVSYAILYQKTDFIDVTTQALWRHSIRLKYKIENKTIAFSTECYYQPNTSDFDDYIILGTTKLILFPENKINFLIQDVFNIRSNVDIVTIHNLSVGIGVKFNKKFEKIEKER